MLVTLKLEDGKNLLVGFEQPFCHAVTHKKFILLILLLSVIKMVESFEKTLWFSLFIVCAFLVCILSNGSKTGPLCPVLKGAVKTSKNLAV